MAIALKNKEKNEYIKIILDKSYINIHGLYIRCVVYPNKTERDKEKIREKDIINFYTNMYQSIDILAQANNEYIESNNITLTDGEVSEEIINKHDFLYNNYCTITDLYNFLSAFSRCNLITQEKKETFKKSSTFIYLLKMLEKNQELLTTCEFNEEWIKNPVIILRSDTLRVNDYLKQDFDLPTFYKEYKNILNQIYPNAVIEDI